MNEKKGFRVVLTGGPCCGKTTLLDYAATFGFQIVPEAARMIIEEEQRRDSDLVPWKDNYNFQRKVIKTQLELEHSYDSKLLLCDRGVFDTPGFCDCARVPTPDIISKLNPSRYNLVVIPDPLPRFVNDSSRKENPKQAREIHQAIVRSYQERGYDTLFLPVFESKEKRGHEFIGMLERAGVFG